MANVIGVRFKDGGKIYFFSPGELNISQGNGVIVETARGVEYGDVVQGPTVVPDEQIIVPLKPVIRVATATDTEQRVKNRGREEEAHAICLEKIKKHELEMKLVDVEYSFNGSKITFYFTADGRIDFRELVKDLASVFKTRIELRQIGVRDEAKMLGGLGSCGRPICCNAFLSDFSPVSIKMAKEQNLSLSPNKISGICGRLMCCLQYEQECYETMRSQMPRCGREVMTADGPGTVLENNVITEKTKVKVALSDGTYDVREYPFREVTVTGQGRHCAKRVCRDGCEGPCAEHGHEKTPPEQDERAQAAAAGEPCGEGSHKHGAPGGTEGLLEDLSIINDELMDRDAPKQKCPRNKRPARKKCIQENPGE